MKSVTPRRRSLWLSAVALGVALASGCAFALDYQMHYKVTGIKQAVPAEPETTFTSHTFTNCGMTLTTGPSLSKCLTAYADAEVLKPEYNFRVIGGIQLWTVPASGTYRIEALGASGSMGNRGSLGGQGAQVSGDFQLTKGEVVRILVGQMGHITGYITSDGVSGGGGGGSFVVRGESGVQDDQVLLIAAGGGGGNDAAYQSSARPGMPGNGTLDGGDGITMHGGGYRGPWPSSTYGYSFALGGVGGTYSRNGTSSYGGFGGGAAADDSISGGGGWRGGDKSGNPAYSKNNGTNQSNANGVNSGHGKVTITKL
jgi:hypothetical protein